MGMFKGFIAGVAVSFLGVCAMSYAQGPVAYELVQLTPSGNEYVLDHHMTRDDCIREKTRIELDDKELIDRHLNCEVS